MMHSAPSFRHSAVVSLLSLSTLQQRFAAVCRSVLSVGAPDLDLMLDSLNLPAAPSEPLTAIFSLLFSLSLSPCLCAQLDGESPAPEERLQEEHRQPLPLRVHAAEPAP